jgi:hypothetical protein
MAYRNKIYVCFDADTDIRYYRLMQGWKASEHIDFDFYDAHDINNLREDSSEDTIKRKLRERLNNAKMLIVLIGEKTKNLHRFVRWEQEVALDLDIPIVAVNLNQSNSIDSNRCPSIIRDELVLHIPFRLGPIKWAIENWPDEYVRLIKNGETGPRQLSATHLQRLLS